MPEKRLEKPFNILVNLSIENILDDPNFLDHEDTIVSLHGDLVPKGSDLYNEFLESWSRKKDHIMNKIRESLEEEPGPSNLEEYQKSLSTWDLIRLNNALRASLVLSHTLDSGMEDSLRFLEENAPESFFRFMPLPSWEEIRNYGPGRISAMCHKLVAENTSRPLIPLLDRLWDKAEVIRKVRHKVNPGQLSLFDDDELNEDSIEGASIVGIGAPDKKIGKTGDRYIDISSRTIYGPKTIYGTWPLSPMKLEEKGNIIYVGDDERQKEWENFMVKYIKDGKNGWI